MANDFAARLGSALGGGLESFGKSYAETKLEAQRHKRLMERDEQKMNLSNQLQQQENAAKMQRQQQQSTQMAAMLGGVPYDQQGGMPQDMTREQKLQMAAESGYTPNELLQLDKALSTRVGEDLAERKFQSKEQEPQRKIIAQEIKALGDQYKFSDKRKNNLKHLGFLAREKKINTGLGYKILKYFGLAENIASPETAIAEKLISEMNTDLMREVTSGGRATAAMYQNMSKQNPSLFMTDVAIDKMSKMLSLGIEADQQVYKEVEKIKKEYKGRPLPLDILDMAKERALPKMEELHSKQQDLLFDIAAQKLPKESIGFKSETKKNIVQELPSASMNTGKKARDTVTGQILVSNGSEWVPVQ